MTTEGAPGGRGYTPGKGRPTPKRSEAEKRRRAHIATPRDRKEAYRVARRRQREERMRMNEGLRRGDPHLLPPRDQGPVRALARDFVDGRRTLSEYYMWIALLLVVMLAVPVAQVQLIAPPLMMLIVIGIVLEGFYIVRRVRALAAERHPGESTKGVGFYAVMRAMQLRRMRLPKPRVGPGGRPVVRKGG